MGKKVEFLLATGNLVSKSGLDLMQVGLQLTHSSASRSIHRIAAAAAAATIGRIPCVALLLVTHAAAAAALRCGQST